MAFAGSGINLTITVLDVQRLQSIDAARAFVQDRYEYFISSNIRCIYVGGSVFAKGQNTQASLKTLRSLQSALNEYQLGQQVKVNFLSYYTYLLKPNYSIPSEAEFLDEVKVNVRQYLRFLEENDAPFPIQLIPVIETTSVPNWDVSFGFPDGKSNIIVKDDANGFIYTNVMAFKIDSFVWALTKLNFSNIKVMVGQVGWPTDGYKEANASNAERFWKHFLPWVTSNKGTPMRPGVPIDTFMHAITDETKTTGGPLTRHWGIYRSNGEPKYRIDFTGKGRDVFLSTVRGIMRMPRRWCMFNGDRSDYDKVNRLFKWACDQTDCSCLAPGGSCSGLSYEHNVSYAFNLYFQFKFQDEKSCDFDGLASLSSENPSAGDCVFPVEVVKGRQDNYNKPFSFNSISKPTV